MAKISMETGNIYCWVQVGNAVPILPCHGTLIDIIPCRKKAYGNILVFEDVDASVFLVPSTHIDKVELVEV